MNELLSNISQAVFNGSGPAIKDLTEKALVEGHSAEQVLHKALLPAMTQVGQFMMVVQGDDIAIQRSLYIKPEMYRAIVNLVKNASSI